MSEAKNIIETFLQSKTDSERSRIVDDFAHLDQVEHQTVEDQLITLLKDKSFNPELRIWIPSFLRHCARTGSEKAVQSLIDQLPLETSDSTKRWIIRTLRVYNFRKDVTEALLAQLEKEYSSHTKQIIVSALDARNPSLLPVFIAKLDDPYEVVQEAAVIALGDSRSAMAITPLVQKIEKGYDFVATQAINSLVELSHDVNVQSSIKYILDKCLDAHASDNTRWTALKALNKLATPSDEEVIESLIKLICNSEDRITSHMATDVLSNLLGTDASIRLAQYGLKCSENEVLPITNAIRIIGTKPAINHLKEIDDSSSQMERAQLLMEHIGTPAAIDALLEHRAETLDTAKKNVGVYDKEGLQIFQETITQAKRGFVLNLYMSSIIFCIGIILLGVSVYIFLRPDSNQFDRLFGVGGGIAGLGTILTMFYYGPSERINRAVTNLVQIEIAFLGYIRQVTQIMAMFEREYIKDDFKLAELLQLVNSIENTLKTTMPLVDMYTLDENRRPSSSITNNSKQKQTN